MILKVHLSIRILALLTLVPIAVLGEPVQAQEQPGLTQFGLDLLAAEDVGVGQWVAGVYLLSLGRAMDLIREAQQQVPAGRARQDDWIEHERLRLAREELLRRIDEVIERRGPGTVFQTGGGYAFRCQAPFIGSCVLIPRDDWELQWSGYPPESLTQLFCTSPFLERCETIVDREMIELMGQPLNGQDIRRLLEGRD